MVQTGSGSVQHWDFWFGSQFFKNGWRTELNWTLASLATWPSDSNIGAVSALCLELATMRRDVRSWRSVVGGNIGRSGASPNTSMSNMIAKNGNVKTAQERLRATPFGKLSLFRAASLNMTQLAYKNGSAGQLSAWSWLSWAGGNTTKWRSREVGVPWHPHWTWVKIFFKLDLIRNVTEK